jgi:N-acetylglucosaminyldiphosphoundecaprenol N-acetyl-beta-D-mannosaminyltransferase
LSDQLDVLGCRVDCVDVAESVARIRGFLDSGRPAQVVTFGAEMAMLAQRDASYRDVVNAADLVVPDTVGIVWASRMLGQPLRERVAGIELAERLCDEIDVPVFFVGAAEGVARQAADALRLRHPSLRMAGEQHGFFSVDESAAVAERIRASGARLVLVALGFPRQEVWIHENLARLGAVVCIGVGGAFDVWAGRVKRAPAFVRRLGLEWFYRLVTQPRRLGRQLALPAFALKVLMQSLRRR